MKEAITTAPILVMLDLSKPFSIECDAWGKGFFYSKTKDP